MKIEIKGYKNLKNFEVEPRDGSINLIMGMSGSGKSSIGGAICKKDLLKNKTINYTGEQVVKVDGLEDFGSVMYFDKDICNSYLKETDNEEVYDIFIEDKRAVDEASEKVDREIKYLKEALDNSESHYNKLKSIVDDLVGKSLNKNGSLKQTSKLLAVKKSLKNSSNSKILASIRSIGINKFSWIKAGQAYIEDKKCPYFERKMPKQLITKVDKMIDYDEMALSKIFVHAEELSFHIEHSLSEIYKLEEDVISIYKAVKDYENVSEEIKKIESYKVEEMNEIRISVEMKKHFKALSDSLRVFNNHLAKYKKVVGEARKATRNVLNRRTKQINEILEKMSIHYRIKANFNRKKIESYTLALIEDKENLDRRYAMSTGEQNIFSLILFIYKCINSDCKLIVIDDPASYYDDYRKNEIFNLIRDKLDKKTILMMTHDSVYAKYILCAGGRSKRNDLVLYLENVNETTLKEVSKEDFGIFEDFVKERITESADYYQKIVNSRILYEGKNNSHAYGYLSKIIHLESQDDVKNYIDEKNTTESKILDKIKSDFGVDLPLYEGPMSVIDLSNYSILEKAFVAREEKEKFSSYIDELNESVHVNRMLRVRLNPYEFNFCTKRLYERLTDYKKIYTNNSYRTK